MKTLITDIYKSARSLPLWVQIWVFFILVPVNLAGLLFWSDPIGRWIGVLGAVGMIPNVVLMIVDRGFTDRMAVAHLLPWTLLVIILIYLLLTQPIVSGTALWYLVWVVLIVDTISLIFDYKDSYALYRRYKSKKTTPLVN